MLKGRIQDDLKTAMKGGDKHRASVLSLIKSAILYAEVAAGARDKGLPEDDILKILAKEAKQRQDSADIYEKAGEFERRDAELSEKAIIEEYLPAQLGDAEVEKVIDTLIHDLGPLSPQTMGKIIGAAKQKFGAQVDGGRIAGMVKQKLDKEIAQ